MAENRFFKHTTEELTSDKLFERRISAFIPATADEKTKQRVFQMIDRTYANSVLPIKCHKRILLHCREADGLGDISQTFFCAKLIMQYLPDCEIKIALQLESTTPDQIKNLFPVHLYDTIFLDKYEYQQNGTQLESLLKTHTPIGIAVGLVFPQLSKSHYRTFREYGFDWHPDTTGNVLSMGLTDSAEGISIPKISQHSLSECQTPWLVKAIGGVNKLYHMHLRRWSMQMLAVSTIVEKEKTNALPIAIILPLEHSLADLIEWKLIDGDYFKNRGIGKITVIKTNGEETVTLDNRLKELKILAGRISKAEMEILQQHSEKLFGCTGDMSFSEAVSLDKILFYEGMEHKAQFFKSVRALANQLSLETTNNFFNILSNFIEKYYSITESYIPKKVGHFSPDPSYNMKDAHSVPRKSIEEVRPLIESCAEQLANIVKNPQLSEEALILTSYIKRNYNLLPRLLETVKRGIILQNYPDLIEVEKKLWQEFASGTLSIDEVTKYLKENLNTLILPDALQNRNQ